ncbi:tRNA (adenosine(37)-N6)-threonylcarbamoyltransferase complex transferase subunit TsaD [Candidatus Peregrinibacteria bacterium]|nr:tRNA (adenosine(37)-N6)-threonylcarbamoyltransferase complex transferase subunit TsaD [Candidatus Peregrinibacteria bacterium]
MKILGIETSCDETSCAVVENGRRILSNVISSQIALHRKTGGVVPEVAAREHVVKIIPVLEMALKKAKIALPQKVAPSGRINRLAELPLGLIDAIAVTAGPGLLSSLLIGVNAAMTLALIYKKPLIPVNHIEGHIYGNWLKDETPKFPAAVLTVSGGHNELLIWKGHGEYKFLGATLDDAAGEAFDKVARLLGLPYPGGPEIQKAAKAGDPTKYPLPRAWLPKNPFDFSFSGIKTAVLYLTKKMSPRALRQAKSDIAASFQEAVCEVLATKLANAAKKYKVREVQLAGGVSANTRLRELARELLPSKIPLRFCANLTLCTDNAAMIAAAGYFRYKKNPARYKKWRPIIADPNLELRAF